MIDQEEKEKLQKVLEKLSHTTLHNYLVDRTAAIISTRGGHSQDLGSGTCIQIGGRYFIATAGHVLSDAQQNEMEIVIVGGNKPSREVTEIESLNYIYNDDIDVAWLELKESEAAQLGRKFVPLEYLTGGISHYNNGMAIVMGYPAELVQAEQATGSPYHRITLHRFHLGTGTIDPNQWPHNHDEEYSSLSPAFHILLRYDKTGHLHDTLQLTELPEPKGLSGSGIWVIREFNISEPTLWTPDRARLIGIQSSMFPVKRLIKATQIQHWLIMVAERFADISDAIHDHLHTSQSIE